MTLDCFPWNDGVAVTAVLPSLNNDDVHGYSTLTPCYCSMLGRVVSFRACCQWALLGVQITRHYPTIQIYCAEPGTFIRSVKFMLCSFMPFAYGRDLAFLWRTRHWDHPRETTGSGWYGDVPIGLFPFRLMSKWGSFSVGKKEGAQWCQLVLSPSAKSPYTIVLWISFCYMFCE